MGLSVLSHKLWQEILYLLRTFVIDINFRLPRTSTNIFFLFLSARQCTLCVVSVLGQKKLTAQIIHDLSLMIYSEYDIRLLGVNGLGMPAHIVDNCILQNRMDLRWGMYQVLKGWYITQEGPIQAYTNLCTAIVRLSMDFLIEEVLESGDHDVGNSSYPEIECKLMSIERLGFAMNIFIYALIVIVTIYISSHDVINYSYR